ncbi:TonB-dependent receptor [uncultured Desulfobacter sp.]|uniref:TonB-dependent receptor n=1 Tax=uncultured Desulfobacter sp. TaxID=240139 RepID=UPI002AABD3C7|nr:TonB-dependent receptor [uncultured Desulfobacter sp.]
MVYLSKQIGRALAVLLLCAGLSVGQCVFAADIQAVVQNEEEIPEIMVTAQKQTQDVKDVPITMSVFSGFDLEDMNVESIDDIMVHTPNMSYFAAGAEGLGTPNVRGLTASLRSFGTSTAMYVDGVPYTSGFGFDTLLQDIERIEVLKGPQGTLYGKNAEAGVVNVITMKPSNEFRGKVTGEIGEDGKHVASASVSGPVVTDKFYMGVSAKYYEKEGYIEDATINDTANDQEYRFGKINLRLTPSDDLEVSLLAQTIQYDNGNINMNDISASDPRVITSDLNGGYYDKPSSTISALNTSYIWNDIKFEAVFSYWNYKQDSLAEFDFTDNPMAMYHVLSLNDFEKLSGEFRVGSTTGAVSWLIGAYTDKDDNLVDNTISMMGGGYTMYVTHELGAENKAVFAHTDWSVTDKFSLIGGLRYDRDEKEFSQASTNLHDERSYSTISPKIAVRYKAIPDACVFATVSKGYRAGGFNSFAPTYTGSTENLSFDKETVWNYEAGVKAVFFNNRLNLDFSLFYMDISDMQVETAVDNTFTWILNAAQATSKGVEISAQFKATDEISLFASAGITDVTFDEFCDATGNYSGNTNPFAPKYNFNVGAQYRSQAGWFARADVNGYGKMYLDKANQYERAAFFLVDLKAGYEARSFDVYVYAKNLFDETYGSTGYYDGLYSIPSPPREVAMAVTYRF